MNIICSICLNNICIKSFISLLDSCFSCCGEGGAGAGDGVGAAAGTGAGAAAGATAGAGVGAATGVEAAAVVGVAAGAGATAGDVAGAMALFAEAFRVDLCRCGNSRTSLRRGAGRGLLGGGAACFFSCVVLLSFG